MADLFGRWGQVKQELDKLEEGASVFKLIGPVLIRQDLDEAKQNVEKRMDFITAEMCAAGSPPSSSAARQAGREKR